MHLGALWALLSYKGKGILREAAQHAGHSRGYGGC